VHINDSAKYLKVINKRGKAANSDHYWFSENGVRAIFVYLLGEYPYYHDIYDTADKPTLAGYDGAFRLLRDFVLNFGH
jgi:aminopeptidase YwaD